MAYPLFGYTNRALTGAITVGSNATGLDAANLQDPHGCAASGWQTAAGVVTSAGGAYARIDAGSSVTWRAFLLARTNLTASAQVRWRVSNNDDMSSPTYDSGNITAGVQIDYGQSLVVAGSEVSGRYCRVDIDDATNADTFINVPLIYAGPVWEVARGLSWDTSYGEDEGGAEYGSRGGQEWAESYFTRRRADISLQAILNTEIHTNLAALKSAARGQSNILFVPDPADADVQKQVIFGRLKSVADVTYPMTSTSRRAWRARITERL